MTSSEMSESSVPSYFSQSVTPNGKQLHVNVISTRPCWYFHHLRLFVCSAGLFLGTLLIFSVRCGQDSKPPASESHCQIWCQSQVAFIRPHRTQAVCMKAGLPGSIKDAAGSLSRERRNEILAVLSRPLRVSPCQTFGASRRSSSSL